MTSPQAFEGLRLAGRTVRRPDLTFATRGPQRADRRTGSTSTTPSRAGRSTRLQANCAEFGDHLLRHGQRPAGYRPRHRPGAGYHPARHRRSSAATATPPPMAPSAAWPSASALSEVEHVLATQTLWQPRGRRLTRSRSPAAARLGVDREGHHPACHPGHRHRRRHRPRGRVLRAGYIRPLAMAGRMTICNMSIEAGARPGLIAPDRHDVRLRHRGQPPVRPQGRAPRAGDRGLDAP